MLYEVGHCARLLRHRRVRRHQPAHLPPRAGRDADAVGQTLAHNTNCGYADFDGLPRQPACSTGTPPHRRHVHRAGPGAPGRSPATASYVVARRRVPHGQRRGPAGPRPLRRHARRRRTRSAAVLAATLTPTVVSLTAGTARVGWQAHVGPDNKTLTYKVYRDGGDDAGLHDHRSLELLAAARLGFTDTGLAPGSTHTYKVRSSTRRQQPDQQPGSPVTVSTHRQHRRPTSSDVLGDGASELLAAAARLGHERGLRLGRLRRPDEHAGVTRGDGRRRSPATPTRPRPSTGTSTGSAATQRPSPVRDTFIARGLGQDDHHHRRQDHRLRQRRDTATARTTTGRSTWTTPAT